MGTEVAINNCIYIYIYIYIFLHLHIYIYNIYIYNIFPGPRPNSVGEWEDNV